MSRVLSPEVYTGRGRPRPYGMYGICRDEDYLVRRQVNRTRLLLSLSIALICLALTLSHPDRVAAQAETTAQVNSLVEIELPVTALGSNPYDPLQADVQAVFTAASGRTITLPGFLYQPYSPTANIADPYGNLMPGGDPTWRVRFTPDEVGVWNYKVTATIGGTPQPVTEGRVVAATADTIANLPGVIRVGQNPRYFAYASGATYFPVGLNVGWSWQGANGTTGYIDWLTQLAGVGINYARLYVDVPWFIGLDWHAEPGNYTAAQEDLYRLDAIIRAAEERGIALQLVLVWHQGYMGTSGAPVIIPPQPPRPDIDNYTWFNNPLSAGRGGPLPSLASFFSTDQGRALFQQRLRYMVARYSYSSSIFAWEMIDQLDRVALQTADIATDWLRTTTGYLRETDPYRHLITAGVSDESKAALLDPVVLDFRQIRYYQRRPIETAPDQAAALIRQLAPLLLNADRPLLVNEFSLNPWFEPTTDDPTGVHIRETIWTSALSGAAGSAMPWFWDTYVLPNNLLSIFEPLVNFTRGLNFANGSFKPVDVAFDATDALGLAPFKVEGFSGRFNSAPGADVVYRISPDGINPPITEQSGYIYGTLYNAQWSRPQRYIITPPIDTTLTVTVFRSSEQADARLVVLIDGRTAAELTLTPGNRGVAITVPITAGEHSVLIDNLGSDYLQLDSLELGAYITPLRTLALADRESGVFIAWLQHRDYTWQNVAAGKAALPVAARLKTRALPPGMYNVELWDVFSGNIVGQEQVTVPPNGTFAVDLLPITRMIAVRAVRVATYDGLPAMTPTPSPTPRMN